MLTADEMMMMMMNHLKTVVVVGLLIMYCCLSPTAVHMHACQHRYHFAAAVVIVAAVGH